MNRQEFFCKDFFKSEKSTVWFSLKSASRRDGE